jgi:hypothetical protein
MNPSEVVLQEQVIEDSHASGLTRTTWRTPSGGVGQFASSDDGDDFVVAQAVIVPKDAE